MQFRYARHSNDLAKLIDFYTKILAFEVLGSFENHDGYDGVFLGKQGLAWHLEFTSSEDKAEHSTDPDDALVFYPKSKQEYQAILLNLKKYKIKTIKAKNPYWRKYGLMFQDPDGFNIILSDLQIQS